MVVGGRPDWLGEFVSFVSRNEHRDVVSVGVGRQPGEGSGLECEQTRMGPRVVGEDFETLVYPVDDGAYYQTTFAYWRQLLAARATQVGVEPTTPGPSTPTPEGVGTGVTAGGETVSATADPLLDAWTASGTGGR